MKNVLSRATVSNPPETHTLAFYRVESCSLAVMCAWPTAPWTCTAYQPFPSSLSPCSRVPPVCVCACAHVQVHVYICACFHVCVRSSACVHMCMFSCMCVCMHMYTCVCVEYRVQCACFYMLPYANTNMETV